MILLDDCRVNECVQCHVIDAVINFELPNLFVLSLHFGGLVLNRNLNTLAYTLSSVNCTILLLKFFILRQLLHLYFINLVNKETR